MQEAAMLLIEGCASIETGFNFWMICLTCCKEFSAARMLTHSLDVPYAPKTNDQTCIGIRSLQEGGCCNAPIPEERGIVKHECRARWDLKGS